MKRDPHKIVKKLEAKLGDHKAVQRAVELIQNQGDQIARLATRVRLMSTAQTITHVRICKGFPKTLEEALENTLAVEENLTHKDFEIVEHPNVGLVLVLRKLENVAVVQSGVINSVCFCSYTVLVHATPLDHYGGVMITVPCTLDLAPVKLAFEY